MSTSTAGFAVADEDQKRLARLVEHFGGGNRPAYLRGDAAGDVAAGPGGAAARAAGAHAERAAAVGQDHQGLLAEIRQAYKGRARER